MEELDLPQQLIKVVKNMYKNNEVFLKMGNNSSNSFKTTNGYYEAVLKP